MRSKMMAMPTMAKPLKMPWVKYWLAMACNTFRPSPCTPIIEAMTTMPSAIMMVWLMPAMMVGIASGICTVHSFCEREQP